MNVFLMITLSLPAESDKKKTYSVSSLFFVLYIYISPLLGGVGGGGVKTEIFQKGRGVSPPHLEIFQLKKYGL